MRLECRGDTGKLSLGWKDATGTRALEYRNGAGKRGSECRKSEWFYFVFYFRFLVYSVLAGSVPVKVELVEELGQFPSSGLGPQIFVRTSSTADQSSVAPGSLTSTRCCSTCYCSHASGGCRPGS